MKSFYLGAALAALIICSACDPATPTALPTQPATVVVTTAATGGGTNLSAGAPLIFSGDNFTSTDPFHVAAPLKLTVAWNYTGSGQFSFWIENNSEFSTDPKYDRILIKDVSSSKTSGQSDIDLIAGDYVVNIEIASGPWQVTLTVKP
jgi:hypothetical protein